jgi:hypothetical protein
MSRGEAWAGMKDRTNDPFFRDASVRPGMLLTCSGLRFVQLRIRRPVLLNTDLLDAISYFPQTAPQTDRILSEVYGIDFFHLPEAMKHRGSLVGGAGRELWESRSQEEWSQIGKRYQVADVVTFSDWKLNLPVVVRDQNYILYEIR